MKLPSFLQRRLHCLGLPGTLLIALLQRTPSVPLVTAAEECIASSPFGTVLRSAVASAASLGALHSLAGASVASLTTNVPSPLQGKAGTSIAVVVFGIDDGLGDVPNSWEVFSGLPPGLSFAGLTGPGVVNISNPPLTGVPTTAGTYVLKMQAWQGPDKTFVSSPVFTYTIVIAAGAVAPAIATQPTSQTAVTGSTVVFSVVASGSPAPTYQWQKNGTVISGATSSTLTLNSVSAGDAGTYTVVATNSVGSATSSGAVLTVNAAVGSPPIITVQPRSVTVNSGSTVAIAVVATSTSAASYQWRKDGVAIAGATGDTLIVSGATAANAGAYTVQINNSGGSATSSTATLAVTSGQVSRISNMSVRTNLAAGQNLTVGFVTGAPKNLLVRAIGPTLKTIFGVAGFYTDPKFSIVSGGTVIDSNDNWSSSLSATFVSVGAFALDANSKDAALVRTINGANTAEISGTGSGLMLVELYDTDAPGAAARLTNVSARNQVGTGTDNLVGGFVIDGTAARTLLIRGIGPALHDVFGLNGVLADPILEIHQTINGVDTVIASNDNWNASLAPYFSLVGAYAFTNGSKDAALLVTLPPGIYTAQISGANNGTGDGVVEVYEVP